jgi:hypothetical protein
VGWRERLQVCNHFAGICGAVMATASLIFIVFFATSPRDPVQGDSVTINLVIGGAPAPKAKVDSVPPRPKILVHPPSAKKCPQANRPAKARRKKSQNGRPGEKGPKIPR